MHSHTIKHTYRPTSPSYLHLPPSPSNPCSLPPSEILKNQHSRVILRSKSNRKWTFETVYPLHISVGGRINEEVACSRDGLDEEVCVRACVGRGVCRVSESHEYSAALCRMYILPAYTPEQAHIQGVRVLCCSVL